MDISSIKTGDIFYYDEYLAHNRETHQHKCRVLFVGSESLFYDAWWEGIDKWTFVPVKKRLTYYRFFLSDILYLTNLKFEGFEDIDIKSRNKLFLQSPEILLKTTKEEIYQKQGDDRIVDMHSETIVFVPIGPKGGWLKPVLIDARALTKGIIIEKILEHQDLDFIQNNDIIIDRIGLHSGVPSYNVRTH